MDPDYEALREAIIEGDRGAVELTERLVAEGRPAKELLSEALLPGMDLVSWRMRTDHSCFLPEVLLSARTMQACLDVLTPHLIDPERETLATVAIGTVEGDVHDIGKNIVAVMLKAAGFRVINLGVCITPQQFVAVVQEHEPVILGLSALLTSTVRHLGHTIEALEEAGIRDRVKVICGGVPVTQELCDEIGADAYAADAGMGVEKCKELAGAAWVGAGGSGAEPNGQR